VRILVTGAAGFLGSHIVDRLRELEYPHVIAITSREFDLRNTDAVRAMYYTHKPNIVINPAAKCGGIGWNQANPAISLYDNLMIGLNLMEEGRKNKLEKFVQIGSVCGYPGIVPFPTPETSLWDGYPEPTNAAYGIAKRTLIAACQAYRQQYGLNAISILPTNIYGPRDRFGPTVSHVVPAMIKKFVDAKNRGDATVSFWGLGHATREFIYATDCAEAIVKAMEVYSKPEPLNLGSGEEIRIVDLAARIRDAVGFEGKIVWDSSKPDGQQRRLFDCTRAKEELGFSPKVMLQEGLKKTVEWYVRSQA
jgi:GDP-L-fucose synthase